jgi:hypothetical protein
MLHGVEAQLRAAREALSPEFRRLGADRPTVGAGPDH